MVRKLAAVGYILEELPSLIAGFIHDGKWYVLPFHFHENVLIVRLGTIT